MKNLIFQFRLKIGQRIGPVIMIDIDPLGELATASVVATSLYFTACYFVV